MKELQKLDNPIEKINEFSKNLGIEKSEQTILKILKTNDKNEKILSLQSGHWQAGEPWFVIDENDEIHTLVSLQSLKNMLDGLKQSQKENFELRLERAIYQQIPIDFNDVWVVAMDEIKQKAQSGAMEFNLDLDKLVEKIKAKHPNLFVDMQNLAKRVNENERL